MNPEAITRAFVRQETSLMARQSAFEVTLVEIIRRHAQKIGKVT